MANNEPIGNSFSFNTTVNGGNPQINMGQTVNATQTNNYGQVEPTVEAVLAEVEKALPEEKASEVMPELRTFAALPVEEVEKEEPKTQVEGIINKLAEWTPAIRRNLMLFGAGALQSLCQGNPVLAGIYAICKANSDDSLQSLNQPQDLAQDRWGAGITGGENR